MKGYKPDYIAIIRLDCQTGTITTIYRYYRELQVLRLRRIFTNKDRSRRAAEKEWTTRTNFLPAQFLELLVNKAASGVLKYGGPTRDAR